MEKEISKKEKKCQYACNLFNNVFKEKQTDAVNMRVKNTATFPKKKKRKSVNVPVNF